MSDITIFQKRGKLAVLALFSALLMGFGLMLTLLNYSWLNEKR